MADVTVENILPTKGHSGSLGFLKEG